MQVELKFDNCLKFPDIEILELNTNPNESNNGIDTSIQQTKLYGITTPLIKVNNFTVPFNSIIHLELTNGKIPRIKVEINDGLQIMQTFDKPTADNKIQLQIIPPFDNAYKKINLMFYILNHEVRDSIIYIEGIYYVHKLYDVIIKAYGQLTTYELFEQVSKNISLGFCSNVSNTNDKRYIYSPNIRYEDLLNMEIKYCGEAKQVFDWWIDYWNNINFVDIYERMQSIDKGLTLWAYPRRYVETDASSTAEPVKQPCLISNHNIYKDNQMYISEFEETLSVSNNIFDGTDKIIGYYDMNICEEYNMLLQDGDVNNNIYIKYIYMGENFGDYNYISKSAYRNMVIQKNKNNTIMVKMFTPQLALMKGHKIDMWWFKTGNMTSDISNSNIETNNDDNNIDNSQQQQEEFILDKQISGQYYINEVNLLYNYNGGAYNWVQELILSRPSDQIEHYNFDDIKF